MLLPEILSEANKKHRKILAIVGDGIDPMHDLRMVDRITTNMVSAQRIQSLDRRNLIKYENVRSRTQTYLPNQAYQFLFHLATKNLLNCIITTNYDSFLDTMFDKTKNLHKRRFVINPAIKYRTQDPSGYSETIPSNLSSFLRIYKLHGSLNYLICRKCKHLSSAPEGRLTSMPLCRENISRCPSSSSKRPRLSSKHPGSCDGNLVHVTDWNLPGFSTHHPIFASVIDHAMREITARPFAVFILGFKGNHTSDPNYSEELNIACESIKNSKTHWLMCLSKDQEKRLTTVEDRHLFDLVNSEEGHYIGNGKSSYSIGKDLLDYLIEADLLTPVQRDSYLAMIDDLFSRQGSPYRKATK